MYFVHTLGLGAPRSALNYWSSNSYLEYRLIILLMLYCYNQLVECLPCCAHSLAQGSSQWQRRGEGGQAVEILIKFSWGQNVIAPSPFSDGPILREMMMMPKFVVVLMMTGVWRTNCDGISNRYKHWRAA